MKLPKSTRNFSKSGRLSCRIWHGCSPWPRPLFYGGLHDSL